MTDTTRELRREAGTRTIRMEIARYRPGRDAEPVFEGYDVPLMADWAVLDGLTYVKDRLDGSLSFRWSCRMGVCGSCGMTVNGEPRLTCGTFLTEYGGGPVRIEPLKGFPIIRDLIVDIEGFLAKLSSVRPWLVREGEELPLGTEYAQTPAQLEAYKQYSECINCLLCYSACPVYVLDPDFLGPAAIALAQRYNLDSRDMGDRFDVLNAEEAVWGCTFVGECTRVCPKHVDPAEAIQRYKVTAAMRSVLPWGRR
ncbi:succinate dehydrogenase iron-sulfur subunit [Actinomadura sp. ATCC 31491]|uniref:Fumarate reductase iron-sulfur subunit n=1 Tax=Actinomadura luzonensis TaxID=2805427 RepID=A0ABT0FXX3_9ACTN|nr:succinate dehydrogenase iron-sulfur subunit [Actinomadura luzonensis]MCK2217206.1 succinate dehydrogenase iron-sulfur subunit [Actinomadura luzonensis]